MQYLQCNISDAISRMQYHGLTVTTAISQINSGGYNILGAISWMQYLRLTVTTTISRINSGGCNILDAISWIQYLGCNILGAISRMQYLRLTVNTAISWKLYDILTPGKHLIYNAVGILQSFKVLGRVGR